MDVSISVSPDTINLGETVTVTYSSTGAQDTQLLADNMANNSQDLGPGDQSGTIKLLPLWSGTFNISITGIGMEGRDDSTMGMMKTAVTTVQVN
jgi:hypothetical protein